jgi:hypothetical protein
MPAKKTPSFSPFCASTPLLADRIKVCSTH